MTRLRRSDCTAPGISRVRRGKGFSYLWPDGRRVVEPDVLQRISDLVLPPAWTDVWICPWPNGHIQAIGSDAAGRRQYRYHDAWRLQRDMEKHERVLSFARRLPPAREKVREHLRMRGLPRERVLAASFRLLDLGFFRIGGEAYAEDNGTFGLATMRREHVTIRGDLLTFDYVAKGSKQLVQSVIDADVRKVLQLLMRRDDGGEELLAYKDSGRWHDVTSADINAYLKDVFGTEVSAKDFRTWHATVFAAVGLAVSSSLPQSPSARKRAVSRVVTEVSNYLGNTPAVCRSSYIDPRVVDLYDDGVTIARSLERLGAGATFGQPATHGAIEAAVLRMLRAPRRPMGRKNAAKAGRKPTAAAA